MNIKLDGSKFFSYYAFHPTASELSGRDRRIALLGTLLLALTLGLGHLACRAIFYDKNLPEKHSRIQEVATKTGIVPLMQEEKQKSVASPGAVPATPPQEENPVQDTIQDLASRENLSAEQMERLELISKEKLQELDFKEPFLPIPTLRLFAPKKKEGSIQEKRETSRLKELSANQVIELLHSICYPHLLLYLSDDQIGELDFEKAFQGLARDRIEEVLRELFPIDEDSKRRMELIPAQRLIKILPFFDRERFDLISKEKLQQIDFKRSGLTQQGEVLFAPAKREGSLQEKRETSRLKELSANQLIDLFRSLPSHLLRYCSDEQIGEIDFEKAFQSIESFQRESFLNKLFPFNSEDFFDPTNEDSKRRIQSLSNRQIDLIFPYLDKKSIHLISDAELRALHFSKGHRLSEGQFDALFPKKQNRQHSTDYRSHSRFQQLTWDQIGALGSLIDPMRFSYLSDEQLKEADFDKLFCHSQEERNPWWRRDLLKALFPTSESLELAEQRIHLIPPLQLGKILPFLTTEAFALVSKENLQRLNFKEIALSPREFKEHFLRHPPRIQELTQAQLADLAPLIDAEALSNFSNEQVWKTDFEALFKNLDAVEKKRRLAGLFPSLGRKYWETSLKHIVDKDADRWKAEARMGGIPLPQLETILPFLEGKTLTLISERQLKSLDFKKTPLSNEQFDALFPKPFINQIWDNYVEISRIKELRDRQIADLIDRIGSYQFFSMTREQLSRLDFTSLFRNFDDAKKKETFERLIDFLPPVLSDHILLPKMLQQKVLHIKWNKQGNKEMIQFLNEKWLRLIAEAEG